MIKCLNCQKEFEPKRETAKFCKTSCRVLWHRKNGDSRPLTKVQTQVLYNTIMDRLDKIQFAPPKEVYDSPPLKITYDEPSRFQNPQIALKSFEQWKAAKHECENEEQWEKIKAGIEAASNLSTKQKDLLIKYS